MAVNTLVSRSSVALSDDARKEFRIFRRGPNPSTKGIDLFDDEAARSVMAAAAAYANDYAIDREHASLDPAALAARADAGAALGYFRLAVRNGELFAVQVRWTDLGKRVLASKEARYLSPAFVRDAETGRVLELVNCSAVAQPATCGATELVAASRLGARTSSVIAARMPITVRARVENEAAKIGLTAGQFVRCLALLATSNDEPESTLKNLRVALRLEEDATAEEIRAALDKLLTEVDADLPQDPTAASADPAPQDDGVSALARTERRGLDPLNTSNRTRFASEFVRKDIPTRTRDTSTDGLTADDARRANEIRDPEKRARFIDMRRSRERLESRPLTREERAFCAREHLTESEFRDRVAALRNRRRP